MREQKWKKAYLWWMSLLLVFLLAGCFMDAGSQQPPVSTGVVQAVTAQSTEELIVDASPTLEDIGLPTETPADLPLMPTETPVEGGLPFPTETPVESVFIPTETPADLPLFPTETPFDVILATDVLVPTDDPAQLFVSSTPPDINFDVPTATVDVVIVPTTDPGQLFASSTPPDINFDVPTATLEMFVPTQEILNTPESIDQGGGDTDLIAMALATATAVTNLYNQSISGASAPPNLPPVVVPLSLPSNLPAVLPVECLAPEYVGLSQVIGAPALIVQFTVLDPNPDYSYTWTALVDGRLNAVGAATGSITTLSFNQRGTYEMRLQVRLSPGKELVAADGTRQNCQQDFIVEHKISVVG
ncbi:MAG: hypothetical protein K8L97_20930 [Anaerolineae bacterium]|nr:hypothetical protein [Anaerolineae bacterium]